MLFYFYYFQNKKVNWRFHAFTIAPFVFALSANPTLCLVCGIQNNVTVCHTELQGKANTENEFTTFSDCVVVRYIVSETTFLWNVFVVYLHFECSFTRNAELRKKSSHFTLKGVCVGS